MPQHNFTLLVNQTISQQPRPSTTLPVPSPLSGSVTHAPSATPVPSVPLCLYPYPYQSTTPITRQPKHNICCSNSLTLTLFGSLLWRGFFQSCYLNWNRGRLFRWFCLLPRFLWFCFFFAFILVFCFIFHFLFFGFFRWWFSFLGWWFNLLFLLWRLKENGNC